jgi:hypothetical protein
VLSPMMPLPRITVCVVVILLYSFVRGYNGVWNRRRIQEASKHKAVLPRPCLPAPPLYAISEGHGRDTGNMACAGLRRCCVVGARRPGGESYESRHVKPG